MEWYFKLVIYFITITTSMVAIYQIDFSKFMRKARHEFAIFVWFIISLALGYLIGSLFIEIAEFIKFK